MRGISRKIFSYGSAELIPIEIYQEGVLWTLVFRFLANMFTDRLKGVRKSDPSVGVFTNYFIKISEKLRRIPKFNAIDFPPFALNFEPFADWNLYSAGVKLLSDSQG